MLNIAARFDFAVKSGYNVVNLRPIVQIVQFNDVTKKVVEKKLWQQKKQHPLRIPKGN